ncbi:MAG: hypothetical protein JRG96_18920 [Deltaproteobacteria bacterium]|nr:hypothetical protein [Deltaproteobacteria bacterium]
MRMTKSLALAALVSACSALLAFGAHAASIGFVPSSQTVAPGDLASVDVVVSDLAGEIVSAYDLDITYDDSVISAQSVVLTSALGNESSFEAFYDSDLSTSGVVDIAGLSLLSDAELLSRQGGDSVVLATITFRAGDAGTSSLDFVFDAFNDIKGSNGRVLDVTPESGSIGVVPEPTSAALFFVGFAVAHGAIRKGRATTP